MKKLVLITCLVLLTSCSAFRPDTQTLHVSCNVPGTIMKVNGDRFDCPAAVEVRRDKSVTVEGYKAGHDRYFKLIGTHLSTAAKWDALGTVCWFFPVFGFAYPGAWDLDTTEVYVDLNPLTISGL